METSGMDWFVDPVPSSPPGLCWWCGSPFAVSVSLAETGAPTAGALKIEPASTAIRARPRWLGPSDRANRARSYRRPERSHQAHPLTPPRSQTTSSRSRISTDRPSPTFHDCYGTVSAQDFEGGGRGRLGTERGQGQMVKEASKSVATVPFGYDNHAGIASRWEVDGRGVARCVGARLLWALRPSEHTSLSD